MRLAGPLSLALLALGACGGGEDEAALPALVWSWIPIEGAVCSDGSGTGVGVEPGPGSAPDVLVFLMGGGACWDALTCFPPAELVRPLARPGPYGEAELRADLAGLVPGSIFDRSAPGNPYATFTFVFVPYCTGDVHAGDTVRDYPLAPRPWHHKGRVNVARALDWLAANLPAPRKVVVSGASAGGFGSLLAFERARRTWPSAKGYLVDDSGPPLAEIPALTRAAWQAAWDLGGAVADACGVACALDLSPLIPAIAARHPGDRLALLSSTADEVIRGFFGAITLSPLGVSPMGAGAFEAGLRDLAREIEDDAGTGETHAFVVEGSSHTMLGSPADFTSQGTALFEWLRQQVEDDPAWSARIPPPG